MNPRQSISVGLHINPDNYTFAPEVHYGGTIAAVRIVDGLTVQSADPGCLRALADAFRRAADSIDDTADSLDTASSASRQHYIDTGEYLPVDAA